MIWGKGFSLPGDSRELDSMPVGLGSHYIQGAAANAGGTPHPFQESPFAEKRLIILSAAGQTVNSPLPGWEAKAIVGKNNPTLAMEVCCRKWRRVLGIMLLMFESQNPLTILRRESLFQGSSK